MYKTQLLADVETPHLVPVFAKLVVFSVKVKKRYQVTYCALSNKFAATSVKMKPDHDFMEHDTLLIV